jgi:glycosyltransferase involved in cell wall biosynthesis
MRILVTLHNFVPEPTMGAENVAIAQMRELLGAGHKVALFYAGNVPAPSQRLEALGLSDLVLFRVPYHPTKAQVLLSIRKPWIERQFGKALRSFSPDVVLFHHLVRLSLSLPLIAVTAGIPTAYVLHDYYWLCPSYSLFAWDTNICPGGSPGRCARCLYETRHSRPPGVAIATLGKLALGWRNRVIRHAMNSVDLFISPSQSIVSEAAVRGANLAPVVIVQNGQDIVPPLPPPSPNPGRVRFGYIGGVYRKKGLDVLTKAFHGKLGRQLTIRGFPDPESLSDFRTAEPTFRGQLQLFNSSRTSFYSDVDVVVVPSLWLENQPTVILEAFAHGRPVLASRIGGVTEMFHEGQGGRFFSAGDASSLRRRAEELNSVPNAVGTLAAHIPPWPSWSDTTSLLITHLDELIRARRRLCSDPCTALERPWISKRGR